MSGWHVIVFSHVILMSSQKKFKFLSVLSHIICHVRWHVVQISLKNLGRMTCWSICHPNFLVGWHVVQNVIHDNILSILMTCHNIWPKSMTFLGFVLVILAFLDNISRQYLGCPKYVIRHIMLYQHCQKCFVILILPEICGMKYCVVSTLSALFVRNVGIVVLHRSDQA